MTKSKSGLILIAVGVGMQILGRIISALTGSSPSVASTGAVALIMFASVVMILFGIYRIIAGRSVTR